MADPRVEKARDIVQPWCSTAAEAEALAVSLVSALFPNTTNETGLAPGGNHALLVGRLMGSLLKADAEPSSYFQPLSPVAVMTPAGDYSNQILVSQPSGKYLITVTEV